MPQTLATPAHSEVVIKKSRFIGCVQPVPDRSSAQQLVAALRAEHPDARHVCWALLAGGDSAAVDDGEPSGTAGRPMLEVLRHQDLEGVLATVVRYFGGIKLGAGGLVRAYTESVAQALLVAQKIPIVRRRTLVCDAPYAFEGLLRREIDAAGAQLIEVSHGIVLVSFTLSATEAAEESLKASLAETGQGKVVWKRELG